ncbi:S1 RNA-binding domain-containing protein [bacterium]|nr:S1 RNA-binding domain-containing protein [bacterium]
MMVNKKKNSEIFDEFPKEGDIVEGVVLEKKGKNVWVDLGITLGVIFGREYLLARNSLRKIKPGEKIKAKVIEVNGYRGSLELSLRGLREEIKWEKIRQIKEEGKKIEGKVVSVNKGGLLVKINDIQGFLPISHFSEKRLQVLKDSDRKDLLKTLQKFVGESLEVKILNLSLKTHRLVLSEK